MKASARGAAFTPLQRPNGQRQPAPPTPARPKPVKRTEVRAPARVGCRRRKTPDWWPAFRNSLRVFMRHWLAGLLGLERPDLYACLPDTFALGHPLPPPVHPRRRWLGNGNPLHLPRAWDPQRVLQDRRWRWLMKRPPARTDAEAP